MARLRGSPFPRRSGSQRRRVSWSLGPHGTFGGISSSAVVLAPINAQALLDDLTIVRIRGRLLVNLETAAGAGEGFEWAMAMAIVSENAAGIGVTAVPDPIADIGWDGWILYESGVIFARDASPLDEGGPAGSQLIELDSKAMRKLHLSDVLVAVFATTETGTSLMRPVLASRILSKLP